MKAKDTVIDRKVYEGNYAYEERVKQAETSFRAGVQVMVEWMGEYFKDEHWATEDAPKWESKLQDKLKEWGVG